MSLETYQTNILPGEIVTGGQFDSGLFSCMTPDEFELGDHITRRYKLPLHERALFDGSDTPVAERPIAEDNTVVVIGINGSIVSVADVCRGEDGRIIEGEARTDILTCDGWIQPYGGLPEEAVSLGFQVEELIDGYYINANNLAEQEAAEVAAMARVRVPAKVGTRAVSRSISPPLP